MQHLVLPLFLVIFVRAHTQEKLNAALIIEIFGSDVQKNFDENTEVDREHDVTETPRVDPQALGLNNNAETKTTISCVTDRGEVGECVQYYLCDDNSTIITDGVGIIDLRYSHQPTPTSMRPRLHP
ncbi:hypothetical protein EVAR_18592_1 [Eumeta japonica]|uniref:PPAF-2-like Clip domain-containing protein n=1 Tax=Eumeta variegata TaxID=151549 RepID=A0A4C1V4B0_EUMVA|nr:hypothetical protein EVAR_18592_1 [Eumeta japonica]